ncbi:putative LRR receptor-like serine/threonine-protein kinase [Exaiptasia diaphana]|nr:putative LRR receptor-like serine/threonine-protein kinase [Exaiptasia diaphana]
MNFLWSFLLFSVYLKFSLSLNQQEISALKKIKTKWNVSDLPGEPNCKAWYRHIRCNEKLNVVSLDFGFAKPELLSGSIPEALCNLTFLEELKLFGNRLSGTIPTCIGDLVHLKYLDFSGNCLGGEIPGSLGNLIKMEYFDLSVNHHVNFSFSHRDLCEKSIKSNGLTGALPASLGKMNKVKFFYLSGNKLSGPIPESIGNLSNVMYMYINANSISGSLPKSIGNLKNLQDLQLNKNNLSGVLPKEIGNCSSLRIIQMNRNLLGGRIPDTIGNLAQLQALELLDNELTGKIPEFKTTPVLDLNLFDVRNNNLTGRLPVSFGDAPLRYLFVSNNINLKGISNKLPEYIEANYSSRSVVDERRHFDCPGFNLLSRVFKVTAPLVQLDPEYYNYTLCNCKPGFFGNPPNGCRTCLDNGVCQGDERTVQSSMMIPLNFYPVTDDAGTLKGLEQCSFDLANGSFAPCNPKDDCFYGKNGLQAKSGNYASFEFERYPIGQSPEG